MTNELLFFGLTLFLLGTILLAFRIGLFALFSTVAVYSVLMNIFVTKQFFLFGLAITGGNALYGSLFLATDLIGEHYGKREALQAVGIGFFASLIFVICSQVLLLFTPNEYDFTQESLSTLFSVTPRILLGSLLAFAIAQSLDVFLFQKIKILTNGKLPFVRNNVSTILSQMVDTLIFTFVGLTSISLFGITVLGILEKNLFWEVALATFLVKILVAVLDTPFFYLGYVVKK
ncbi:queuosine precursor transporter [Candidatus Peregrinibacteria bacterium]|nr:MAG: queuosine precursor transporter [Candidatus Peregrinibacteria bacterium]